MKTDDLIRALSADTTDAPAFLQTLAFGLSLALLLGFAGLWSTLGLRPDLAQVVLNPVSMMRFVLTLSLAGAAVLACRALTRPEGRAQIWPMLIVLAGALGMWAWAFANTPAEGIGMAIRGKTMVWCLTTIPVLSVLPVAVVMYCLRQGATTQPGLAGAMAGLVGGAAAAAVYALHCTEDSPLFYVTWYGLAIGGVTVASSLMGRRWLHW